MSEYVFDTDTAVEARGEGRFGGYLHDRWLIQTVPNGGYSMAVMLTFVASGAVHDAFASLAVADVFVLFAPAFAVFGLIVIVEEWLGADLLWAPSWLRAIIHAAVIVGTIAAGAMIRSM